MEFFGQHCILVLGELRKSSKRKSDFKIKVLVLYVIKRSEIDILWHLQMMEKNRRVLYYVLNIDQKLYSEVYEA